MMDKVTFCLKCLKIRNAKSTNFKYCKCLKNALNKAMQYSKIKKQ